jgi:hypothetical protein
VLLLCTLSSTYKAEMFYLHEYSHHFNNIFMKHYPYFSALLWKPKYEITVFNEKQDHELYRNTWHRSEKWLLNKWLYEKYHTLQRGRAVQYLQFNQQYKSDSSFFLAVGIEFKFSYMLNLCSTTELHPHVEPAVMVHACNPKTREVEAGRWRAWRVWSLLHSKFQVNTVPIVRMSQKNWKNLFLLSIKVASIFLAVSNVNRFITSNKANIKNVTIT